jgi:hypothetical protein
MEREGSVLCSQQPATVHYLQQIKRNIFLIFFWIEVSGFTLSQGETPRYSLNGNLDVHSVGLDVAADRELCLPGKTPYNPYSFL